MNKDLLCVWRSCPEIGGRNPPDPGFCYTVFYVLTVKPRLGILEAGGQPNSCRVREADPRGEASSMEKGGVQVLKTLITGP